MRILVIGLSRDLPLGPADAMELADHLVRRAAAVQADGEGPRKLCPGPPSGAASTTPLGRACLHGCSQASAPPRGPGLAGPHRSLESGIGQKVCAFRGDAPCAASGAALGPAHVVRVMNRGPVQAATAVPRTPLARRAPLAAAGPASDPRCGGQAHGAQGARVSPRPPSASGELGPVCGLSVRGPNPVPRWRTTTSPHRPRHADGLLKLCVALAFQMWRC